MTTSTGTQVGDPIECESIRRTFGGSDRAETLFIGSVKDNIGHVEAASGIAAVIKTVLMIQNRTIPKQANFESLNPKITPLERANMAIAKHSQVWVSRKRTALVNNYGAAGSNAAIVLQEYIPVNPADGEEVKKSMQRWPFVLTARTEADLERYMDLLKRRLVQKAACQAQFSSLARGLAKTQSVDFNHVWASTACNAEELALDLAHSVGNSPSVKNKSSLPQPIVLCFAGQTGQTANISEDMFRDCKLLRFHLVSQCAMLRFYSDKSLRTNPSTWSSHKLVPQDGTRIILGGD